MHMTRKTEHEHDKETTELENGNGTYGNGT